MDRQTSVFEPTLNNDAKQRAAVIEWLNTLLPSLSLPVNASDEELRALLADGAALCRILNKLKPGSVSEGCPENVENFLASMENLGLPRFQISDLEKGSMKNVLECLITLRAHFMPSNIVLSSGGESTRWKQLSDHVGSGDHSSQGELSPRTYASIVAGGRGGSESKFQRALRSPVMAEPSAALIHHVGHKFHEVFQMKQGGYADLPAAKISELMKSNSLDNAPTQSLLSVVNGILDESLDRKNGEIPHRVACLLRKVVQEIERRISTQAEHLRTQNNLFKSREEKYQSRIRVLETLATGTSEQTPQMVMSPFHQIQTQVDEKKKVQEQEAERQMKDKDVERLMKEKDKDVERLMKEKDEEKLKKEKEVDRLKKEKDENDREIAMLKQELEKARKADQQRSLQMEVVTKGAQQELEDKLKEVQNHLKESKSRVTELEAHSESKAQRWRKKEQACRTFTELQLGALRELRFASQSVRQEMSETKKSYSEDFNRLGAKIKALKHAAENYITVLAENQKLHNELQELKGNIRVYCRIRPFLPGQTGKQSTVEYIGDNGELTVTNPAKQGKEGHRSFKFNKVYGPRATQAEVYADTQPLIQSVLDGYNVCIFAYGQTGSGKTYTMSGPDKGTEEDWGMNYRALNDLFRISRSRQSAYTYEVGVQMVEIYNEQVRDLLTNDSSQRKLGIISTSQNSGLAVPDASMLPVNSPSDVLELMEIGFKNRARGATAMNERSSRSHSVVTVHVRGSDLKNGTSMQGSLHLVDLAGSERIDRSEATGDRLKEAQHINKSLSALGDVIFALAQKSAHVPYRNSKLTQVLQSSLGGQAKTLMFVQLNPDATSFSESLSTLKFAERVSGVELGAARSSKEGNVRELMEQVASLKDTIAKKDEEIERLQLLKDHKNVNPGGANAERRTTSRYGALSPSSSPNSVGGTASQRNSLRLTSGRAASDTDIRSESSDKHSATSPLSLDDLKHQNDLGQNFSADAEMLGFGDAENGETLSDVSDSGLSMGTDNDGSAEGSLLQGGIKSSETASKFRTAAKVSRLSQKLVKEPSKVATGLRKSVSGSSLTKSPSGSNLALSKPGSKRWA